MIMQIVQHQD